MTTLPRICFVGLANLPVLAKEYRALGIGGAALQQTLLAKALARRGFRVSMVVADYGQLDGAVWHDITTYKSYHPDEGLPGLRFIHPRWTRVWTALRNASADVYYVSCADPLVGQVVLFAKRHGRKVIFRVASDSDCDPRELRLDSWRHRTLYHYGLQRVDTILAQTVQQQQALLANYGRRSHLARSMSETADQLPGYSERDIGTLWVSNIRQLKRPDLLQDLARRLPELSFTMAGGPMAGSQQLYEQVRASAAAIPNLRFLGAVAYDQVNAHFGQARVFVNTSEVEGFPNTYLQAWNRGTPVVTFIDPDNLIAREGLGQVVTSMEEMRAAVKQLATDEAAWAAASARCIAFALQEFGEDKTLASYIEAIMSVAAAPS